MESAACRPGWVVLVPVKSSARGKSRIELPAGQRRRLARAMALDTLSAVAVAQSVAHALAIIEDDADGDIFAAVPGVRCHRTARVGLNQAIADGMGAVGPTEGPIATLPGDLPGLLPQDLDDVLAEAAGLDHAVVADRQGTGTTLLTAGPGCVLQPSYGPGSFARHRASGAVGLDLPRASGLRRDVDVLADLDGPVGEHTAAVLAELGLPGADRWSRAVPVLRS